MLSRDGWVFLSVICEGSTSKSPDFIWGPVKAIEVK